MHPYKLLVCLAHLEQLEEAMEEAMDELMEERTEEQEEHMAIE